MSQSSINPHTISVHTKSKKVECDGTCANFTAYRICSHCIAAAEIAHCLPEFLSWFRKSRKQPNLTALVNINMPAGAGKKTSKATQRRKGSSNKESKSLMPVVSRVAGANLASAALQQVPTSNTPVPGYYQSSFPASNVVHVQGTGTATSYPMQSCSFISTPYISIPGAFGSSSFQFQNFASLVNAQINAPARPNPVAGTYVAALLSNTHPSVSRCYGCRDTLKPGSVIPPCPNYMIVASRQYFKDGKEHTSPELSMVYFHANISCIFLQCPGFFASMLHIPTDLMPHLQESHKELLRRNFHMFL